jgi:hypothetical protein
LLNFFAVFRNSMNIIANVKKLFGFFVIDGRKGVRGGVYPRDTLKWGGVGPETRPRKRVNACRRSPCYDR